MDILALAGPVLPDDSRGNRVGSAYRSRCASNLEVRWPNWVHASKGDLTTKVFALETSLKEKAVYDVQQILMVIDRLIREHNAPFCP
jgi:hypothetical protein